VKGIANINRDVSKLGNITYKASSSIKNRLKFMSIVRREADVHSIAEVNTSANQGMDQSSDSVK
jgi:hypothetical protein